MTKRERILVVEDESDIQDLLRYNLKKEGYEVDVAGDGERGLDFARTRPYDLALLDLMLPGIDGLEVCRRLRSDARTEALPVIMLTSKGEEADVVVGLTVGADDYVTKPFSVRELLARIRVALRRTRGGGGDGRGDKRPVQRAGIEVDPVRHTVTVDGRPAALTLAEFRLLHFLMRNEGRVYTRVELLPHVVGDGVVVVDRNIDVHVRNVRRKLGDRRMNHLVTVRGVGYKFESEPVPV
ncbi:MAG TPA: response regulator [Planctomycetota bacterium]|nr:response regulator [Planctomycetota bacterium]